jgi:hypothetical protein
MGVQTSPTRRPDVRTEQGEGDKELEEGDEKDGDQALIDCKEDEGPVISLVLEEEVLLIRVEAEATDPVERKSHLKQRTREKEKKER